MSKVDIKASSLSAADLYQKGRDLEIKAHADAEVAKQGTLRGGSSGCVDQNGEVYGTCHRLALARYKGHQAPIDPDGDSYHWFDAGYANEDAWMQKLTKSVAAMGPEYQLKAEEDCPTKWETSSGVAVTGRPDLMVWKDGSPLLGIELKVVCTTNSAVSVFCEDKPKVTNLIQAAHYSMEHGCPFNLVYSYRSSGPVPFWANKFKDKLRKKRNTYYIDPFIKEFKIGFDSGRIYYIKDNGERVDTPLTAEGIRNYYELIVDMDTNKDLHARVTNKDLSGKMLPWDPCGFCPLKEACDDYEFSFDAWMDKIELISQGD